MFTRDGCRMNESHRVREMPMLEPPKTADPSRSSIRRPNTSDSGVFLSSEAKMTILTLIRFLFQHL